MTEAAPAPVLNIYQRRNAAKKQVAACRFQKTKSGALKFAYITIDDIKNVVENAWNDAGIVLDVLDTEITHLREPWDQVSQYGDRSHWFHIEMVLTVALVNVDDPQDRVVMSFHGEGKDNADKAESKAYTSALKNFYKLEFNIAESKDDPDGLQDEKDIAESNRPESKRREKQAQAKSDPWFNKTEKAVADAIGPDAAFLDGEALAEAAKARRDSVSVKDARVALAKHRQANPLDETLTGYLEKYGGRIGEWPEAKVVECYLDLVDSGVSL